MANPTYPDGLHHVQSGYFHLVQDENNDTWATVGNEEAALAVVWIEDTDAALGALDDAWGELSSGEQDDITTNYPTFAAKIEACRVRRIRGGTAAFASLARPGLLRRAVAGLKRLLTPG